MRICFLMPLTMAAQVMAAPLGEGSSLKIDGRDVKITKLQMLPVVENEFSRRFKWDSFDNPKLKELREKYHFDEVVAPGKDEFEKQLLLLDWVNHRFKKFGKPSSPARGASDILKAIDEGHSFFCSHYGDVFVSAAASMGWIDRPLALRRPDNWGSGSTEHTSTEIWSNQFRKWVMVDPTFAMYVEKDGVPQSAWEIRQDWFYNDAKGLTFVLDKDHKRYRKSDMPVFRGRYAGFGDLALDGGAINPYGFIGYIPNNDLMDRGPDYGGMFISKDKICDGTKWHTRVGPADPEHEPYFPMGQAAMEIAAEGDALRVALRTITPNFKTYLAKFDGGEWKETDDSVAWKLRDGPNRLEVKTVNKFGVEGPASLAVVNAADTGRQAASGTQEPIKRVRLNEQITRLMPAIVADPFAGKVGIQFDEGVKGEIMAKQHEGKIYLFANELDMKRNGKAAISVEGLKMGAKVDVVDENRDIIAQEGKFADEFPTLGIHIYRLARE